MRFRIHSQWLAAALMATLLQAGDAVPAAPARTYEPGRHAVEQPERTYPAATVKVQNRPVVVLRTTAFGHAPVARAEEIERRIARLIDLGTAGEVRKERIPQGMAVSIGATGVFIIYHEDLDPVSGETLEQASDRAVGALTLALTEAHELTNIPRLLKAAGKTALATLVFAFAIWLLLRTYQWLLVRLRKLLLPRLRALSTGGSVLITDLVLAVFRFVLGLGAWTGAIFAADVWLTYALTRFPYTRPWGESLRDSVLGMLSRGSRAFLSTLPDLVIVLFIILITRLLAGLVKRFFLAVERGQVRLPPAYGETAQATSRIVVAVLWLFAVVAAYPYIPGSDTEAFKGVSIFMGVLVSLGSSGAVGQVASGLLLIYSRAFKTGDYIRVGETEGTVLSLGMLSTKIRTVKNEEVNIPNGVMVGTATKNFSRFAREEGVLLHTSVTIGYDAPWRQVHAMLLQAADATPGLLKDPKPFVLQTALSDFYVEYQVNARLKDPAARIPTLAALHANIQDAFNEFGVQIMSPHYLGDPARPKIVPREQWHEPPAEADGGPQQQKGGLQGRREKQ